MSMKFELKKYLASIFVETGTKDGHGVQKALDAGFEKIYSIEIGKNLYEGCRKRFLKEINDGRVVLVLGDSTIALSNVLESINEPATFWLDAHGGYEGVSMGKKMCPLMEELDAIKKHHIKTHTLLVDDRRLFSSENDECWGSEISEAVVKNKIWEINSDYEFFTLDGFVPDDVLLAKIKNEKFSKSDLKRFTMNMNFEIKYPDPDRIDFRDYMMSYKDVKEFSRWKTGYSSQIARRHWLTVGKYESRNIKFKRVNYSLVESYTREHIPVTYSGEKISLVTSLYCEQNEKRLEEYRLSVKLNISNPMIESIVVFYESKNGEKFEDVYPTSPKILIINCNQRPSFGEIFDYTNKKPGLWAIVNADIVLTDDFRLVNKIDLTNRIFALTRWQFVSENDIGIFHIHEKPNKYSQDTWVYRTPMKYPKILKEVRLGEILCDSNLSYHFSRSGTSVLNPCYDIKTFHIHFQNARTQSYENLADAKEKKFDGGFPDNWPESNLCLLEDLL